MSSVTFGRSLTELFNVRSETVLDDVMLNAILKALEVRFKPLEEQRNAVDAAIEAVRGVALLRINEVLIPAIESVRKVQEKGFLIARSNTNVPTPIQSGDILKFTIPSVEERDLFTPSPFTILSSGRQTDIENYVVCRSINYSAQDGEYYVEAVTVFGVPMSGNDWVIGALAGSTIAQVSLFNEAQGILAAQKADNSQTKQTILLDNETTRKGTAADRKAVLDDRLLIAGYRDTAVTSRNAAVTARNDIYSMYRGSLPSPPSDGVEGQWYIDTTDKVIKTFFDNVWSPGISVSLGGYRFGNYISTEGQTEFTVSGGFSRLDVYVSGVLLDEGVDYTLASPKFTLASPLSAGKKVTARGYFASDDVDPYSKADTDARIQAAIAALVDTAPGTLDTLNELAAALGNDPNFAATLAAQIGDRYTKAETYNRTEVLNLIAQERNLTVTKHYYGTI